jgi:hypothetical protein
MSQQCVVQLRDVINRNIFSDGREKLEDIK